MIYLILLVIIGLALTFGGTFFKSYEGVVAIDLPSGTYEMQAWYFIIVVFLAMVLFFVVGFILVKLLTLPTGLAKNYKKNKESKAGKLLQNSLFELEKGHWKKAEKLALKGAKISESTGLDTSLFLANAAKAAQHQGAVKRRDHYFLEARKLAAKAENNLISSLSEVQLRMEAEEYPAALGLINELKRTQVNNTKVIALESEIHERMGDYDFVWTNLSRLKKTFLSKSAYIEKQQAIANAIFAATDSEKSLIERVWSELPSSSHKDQKTVLNYASALLKFDQSDVVESLFSKMINSDFSDPIIHAYTQLELSPDLKRYKQFKKWLKKDNNNPYLNYGAAKQAYQCDLLDDAKKYAEQSIRSLAMPEALALLGKIYEAKGEVVSALQAYKCSVGLTFEEQEMENIELLETISNPVLAGVEETNQLSNSEDAPNLMAENDSDNDQESSSINEEDIEKDKK